MNSWKGVLVCFNAPEDPVFVDLGIKEDCGYREAMLYFDRVGESHLAEYGNEIVGDSSAVQVWPLSCCSGP